MVVYSLQTVPILFKMLQLNSVLCKLADSSGHTIQGVGLRPLACWDCGFESHRRNGFLSGAVR